jgi:hypothetical protein
VVKQGCAVVACTCICGSMPHVGCTMRPLKFTHCGRSTAMEEHGLEARAWECEGECLYI